ncbi:MAG TPA: hypothetical protein VFA20_15740 [Myxococcaceae bacterium]|nr:hypothetical protein [Myxococcaceae bacterium]
MSGGGGHEPGQKPQPHGGDFGRDGALTRGQGFSQRDAFSPAKQAQKPQQAAAAHQTHSAGAKPQQAAAAHQTHSAGGAKPEQAVLQKQQGQQPQAPKSAAQEAQKPQVQQNDANKLAQQSALRQIDRQQAVLQNMIAQQQIYHQDVLLQILMDMRKRFLEWVKELFQLMGQPATH